MWEDIEKRWNEPSEEERNRWGREPAKGREKMLKCARWIRRLVPVQLPDQGTVEDLDLYLCQKVGNEWKVVEKDWEKVRA